MELKNTSSPEIISARDLVEAYIVQESETRAIRECSSFYTEAHAFECHLSQDEITPLAQHANIDRINRARSIVRNIYNQNLTIYETVIMPSGGTYRVIFPPVVEKWGSEYFLVDGLHRLLAAFETVDEVSVLCVHLSSPPPLPCEPVSWEEVVVDSQQRPTSEVFQSYRPDYFRPVSRYFNGEHLNCADIQSARRILTKLSNRLN